MAFDASALGLMSSLDEREAVVDHVSAGVAGRVMADLEAEEVERCTTVGSPQGVLLGTRGHASQPYARPGTALSPSSLTRVARTTMLAQQGPSETMSSTTAQRFTSADLERLTLPEGWRAEVIDGELFVSKQPSWEHQQVCGHVLAALLSWSMSSGAGRPGLAPGVVFAEDDDVAPDVVWASNERLASSLRDGRFQEQCPELIVEVLSPGTANRRRDLEVKLALYSRRGAQEYWVCDWQAKTVDVFRRPDPNGPLEHVAKLVEDDWLSTPLLPDFHVRLNSFFS
jgi:Uma2 family endonuclease